LCWVFFVFFKILIVYNPEFQAMLTFAFPPQDGSMNPCCSHLSPHFLSNPLSDQAQLNRSCCGKGWIVDIFLSAPEEIQTRDHNVSIFIPDLKAVQPGAVKDSQTRQQQIILPVSQPGAVTHTVSRWHC